MLLGGVPWADPGALGATFSLAVLIAGSVVVVATIRRTWMSQTIRELKDLSEVQQRQVEFQEMQLKLMTEQVATVTQKLRDMEQDNASLVRRNRELEERYRRLEGKE